MAAHSGTSHPGTVHVHDDRRVPFRRASRSEFASMLRIHIELHVGPVTRVFHDVVPDLIDLELFPVPPGENRPWWTLVTSGMSSAPMRVREPGRPERLAHAELCMLLPPDWPFFDPRADEEHWPLSMLGELARLPHQYDTWLGPGHTIANGSPPEPYASVTRFSGALVVPPRLMAPGFSRFRARPRVTIELLAVIPLLPDEVELARRVSAEEMARLLTRNGVTELLDPGRDSAVPGTRET